jgi:hypothetical protein
VLLLSHVCVANGGFFLLNAVPRTRLLPIRYPLGMFRRGSLFHVLARIHKHSFWNREFEVEGDVIGILLASEHGNDSDTSILLDHRNLPKSNSSKGLHMGPTHVVSNACSALAFFYSTTGQEDTFLRARLIGT